VKQHGRRSTYQAPEPREVGQEELDASFNYIRDTFFPRWDRQHDWVAKVGAIPDRDNLVGFDGECDPVRKRIIINQRGIPKSEGLDSLLIHEIAHAVAGLAHDKRWRNRMEKAALKAIDIGRTELAVEIREAFYMWDVYAKGYTYDLVENAVLYEEADFSFDDIIAYVAREMDMPEDQIRSKYWWLPMAYNELREQKETERQLKSLIQKAT
jgi:hypothetical protein